MSDIELVIKIPEGLKNDFESEQWTALFCMEMKNALEKATPIPKGHGAIKDVSQIEIPMCEDRTYERWVQVAIDSAPTIIAEDKEQK